VPSVTPLFSGLVEYKILSPQGDTTVKFNLSSNDQSFAMYYPKTPGGVIVDPDNWILDKAGTVVEGLSTFPEKVMIYPNPVTNRFAISMPPNLYNVARIIDVNGRDLARYTIPPGATLFSQNLHVPTGIYFLHLTGSKQNTVHKILVNN
jgi:hypothetical protein